MYTIIPPTRRTSGGNKDDLLESIELMEKGIINPAAMIHSYRWFFRQRGRHYLKLTEHTRWKKLITLTFALELTAINSFAEKG